MSEYSDKVKLGMTQEHVLEILGPPDRTTKSEVFEHWEWENLTDDEKSEIQVHVSFLDGIVSSLEVTGTTPRPPE